MESMNRKGSDESKVIKGLGAKGGRFRQEDTHSHPTKERM